MHNVRVLDVLVPVPAVSQNILGLQVVLVILFLVRGNASHLRVRILLVGEHGLDFVQIRVVDVQERSDGGGDNAP